VISQEGRALHYASAVAPLSTTSQMPGEPIGFKQFRAAGIFPLRSASQ